MTPKIEVSDDSVTIREIQVSNRDVAEYLRALPDEKRVLGLVRAIEVGIYCLQRAEAGQNLEFVKRQIESLLSRVESALERLPARTEEQIVAKVGAEGGPVLKPLRDAVEDVREAASKKIEEVRNLLQQEIDPANETSTIGKVLRTLRDLLDPKREDSIQGSFKRAIEAATSENGTLANAVQKAVEVTLKPLEERVNDLTKEVRAKEAVAEALGKTIEKGASYEEDVLARLQQWAQASGVEVHHVGTDNRPGDILLVVADDNSTLDGLITVVVEVRDRQEAAGRKVISETIDRAMIERKANAALYVSKTRQGLAKEIGDWAEGRVQGRPWIACIDEHLVTGARFVLVQERLRRSRERDMSMDPAKVSGAIESIRTGLKRIAAINTKITEIRNGADDIQHEAERLRDEIRAALDEIEQSLKKST